MQGKPRFWGREQAAGGRRGEPCEAEELGERRSVKGLGGWGSAKGLPHGAFHASSAALGAFFGSPKGRKGPGGEFFWLFFSEKRRKGPVSSLILSDRLMLSGFFHRNNASELRRRCREWFLASRHGLLSYALRHADGMTDVELLLAEVMRRVAEAIASGRVPIEAIAPYTLRCLRNGAVELRRKNARRLEAERRFTEAEVPDVQAIREEFGRIHALFPSLARPGHVRLYYEAEPGYITVTAYADRITVTAQRGPEVDVYELREQGDRLPDELRHRFR